MKNLIIIGAGGFGRELLSYAIEIMEYGDCNWIVKGFIDDNLNAFNGIDTGYPILGTISEHKIEVNAVYVCAIGDGKFRLDIGRKFQKKGAEFINFIHPSAKIRERVKFGVGNIICPNSSINPDVTVGDFVLLNSNSGLAHDCVIGDGCSLMGGNSVNGNCTIGKCVFMGANSLIIPGRKIGDYVKISAGAVIFTNVKPGKTMIGNPAMILK
ncbi:acetyltransferase [Paenisporosarcina sp. NPDC076898]|uniref:acetyltransferase n=1 Tax=unclassified Paenisporosarcina TaxID=2642018 RepID=UPI003D01AFB4